jgi:putative tryptophan/tyrosine transport system substrate-binding protein
VKRRQFITLLGGAATMWPLRAGAQQQARLPTVGFLGAATPSAWGPYTAAFVARLRELGWIEGRTIAIEYRWADGRAERYAAIAAEFVQRKVDVIVTSGTAAGAVKLATSVIPIVFAVAVEPLSSGLVANLARPGGNLTGLSSQTGDLGGKRLDLLREVVPGLRRLAIMGNADYSASMLEMGEVQAAARALGVEVVTLEVRRAEDFAPAFQALRQRADALYISSESLISANRVRIVILALAERIPTIYGERMHAEAGGLMAYGANLPDLFRRSAEYVDKILRGAKPGDLPVEQPIKFDLVINLITAKALGLEVPPTLLARADEVIE